MRRKFVSILQDKSLGLLLLAAFLASNLTVSAKAQTGEVSVEKKISEIRREVNAVNKNAARYTKKTKSVDDVSLEGTEATYFFSGKDLKKITAQIYGETRNATAELYYQNGDLLFALVNRRDYNVPIGTGTMPKVVRSEEQRFYFRGAGELLRLLVGKKELSSGDERYSDLKDELTDVSSKLKAAGIFSKVR